MFLNEVRGRVGNDAAIIKNVDDKTKIALVCKDDLLGDFPTYGELFVLLGAESRVTAGAIIKLNDDLLFSDEWEPCPIIETRKDIVDYIDQTGIGLLIQHILNAFPKHEVLWETYHSRLSLVQRVGRRVHDIQYYQVGDEWKEITY